MKKHVLKIFNKKKLGLVLLAFIGFGSMQLNAQEKYTNASADGLWATLANWENTSGGAASTLLPVSGDRATLKSTSNIDLGGVTRTVGSLYFNQNSNTEASNGTLVVDGSADDFSIANWTSRASTVSCDVTVSVAGKQFRNRNAAQSKLIFNGTVALGTNTVEIDSRKETNPIEFNGTVTGSGNMNISDNAHSDGIGGVSIGAAADLSGFSGDFITLNNPIISYTTTAFSNDVILDGTGSFQVDVADTFTGTISRSATTAGAAQVTFNKSQNNMSTLTVDTQPLALDFHADATLVQFSGAGTLTGVVDLKNYVSGVLRIGTTSTSVSQTILDTWLIDGVEPADGTITQDATGYITVSASASSTYTSINGANGAGLNWHDSSSWVGGVVPSQTTDNVIVNAGLTISDSDVEVNDVVINARITVSEGLSLTANDLAQNSQLIMKAGSSSYSSVIVNTESGDEDGLIYDRIIANNPTNDLVSSPVSGLTMDGFYQSSNNETRLYIENAPSYYGERYFVGPFNNTSGVYEFYTSESADGAGDNDNNVEFVSGKGYRMATKAGATGTVRFAGAIKKDAVSIDITDGGDATYGQWNLIGNPYPSYLDFDTFWTANSGQFETGANQAIYGWNGSGYTAWNALSGAKIAPSQGFFVKTTASTTGTVTFTPAMRVTGNSDDFIAGKSANNLNKALAKINLSNATTTYTTDIYFVDNQTRGLDSGYDAGAFAGSTDGIYTNLVEGNTGVDFLIQALPYNDFNNVVVPVAINSDANTELTISLDVASLTLPANTYVYLKDNLLNTTTLLNDADYVFTPDTQLSGTGRFFVEFSAKEVLATEDFAVNEMLIYANQTSKSIIIKGILKTAASAKVFDIQGRMVLEQKLDSSIITNVVNANALNAGVYIIQLEGKTQKVIIN